MNLLIKRLVILLIFLSSALYISSCKDNTVSDYETDDQFLERVVRYGYSKDQEDDDNIIKNEMSDLDNGGPVLDGPGDEPIDSLLKWGSKIKDININIQINNEGDSIKNVTVNRTYTADYHIVYQKDGAPVTVIKPYTGSTKRNLVFRRVNNTNTPALNWRLYKIGLLDGQTLTPQKGTDHIKMNKIEIFINNELAYTFNGDDFTNTMFTTRRFNGAGIPEAKQNDIVRIRVSLFSKIFLYDIVAWHWAKNQYGHYSVPFTKISETPSGDGWNREYEKTFYIYSEHRTGAFNGFISTTTLMSLYDDNVNLFASDLFGMPYRIKQQ